MIIIIVRRRLSNPQESVTRRRTGGEKCKTKRSPVPSPQYYTVPTCSGHGIPGFADKIAVAARKDLCPMPVYSAQ